MKKTLYTVLVIILITSCSDKKDKKESTVVLSDRLAFYFEKTNNTTLSQQERGVFNRKALDYIIDQKQDPMFIKNLFTVANHFYNMNDLEAYKTTVKSIAEKAYQLNDKRSMAKSESYLGDYYKKKSINDSAYFCYSKAEVIYSKLKDKKNMGTMLLNKAQLHYLEGDFFLSEKLSLKALACFNTQENTREVYEIYNLLGRQSNDLEEYDKALEYYNKALSIIRNSTNINKKHVYIANSFNNLGYLYQNIKENKKAIAYFEKALKEKSLSKDMPFIYAMLLDNLAYSQFKLKEYSELPELFYKALHIRDSIQMIPGIVLNKVHLSEYYQDQKDNNKAVQYAKEAYSTAKKGIDPRDIMLSLKQLSTVDANNKSGYLAEYIKISDSIKEAEPIRISTKISRAELMQIN